MLNEEMKNKLDFIYSQMINKKNKDMDNIVLNEIHKNEEKINSNVENPRFEIMDFLSN